MTLAGGVDGGGTQTRCLVIDEYGNIMGIGVSGASKPDAADPEAGRAPLHEALLATSPHCRGAPTVDTPFCCAAGVVAPAGPHPVHPKLPRRAPLPRLPSVTPH